MNNCKEQLTLRAIIIGIIGCVVLTASSVYTALRMGALPWPIIFAALVSLFFLKLLSRNTSTLNEANVCHTILSSGSMVAGGLAFTIPGAWMMGLANEISALELLVIALTGVMLGLVCTAFLRKRFIVEDNLSYPIGNAAAETLKAGDAPGKTGVKLFSALSLAAIYAFLRDGLKLIPQMLATLPLPGVSFGIYNSPLSMAVGYMVGARAVAIWFAGALIANFGLLVGGTHLGLWDTTLAKSVVSNLGMGCMMGCGLAVIVRDIFPKAARSLLTLRKRQRSRDNLLGLVAPNPLISPKRFPIGTDDTKSHDTPTRKESLSLVILAALIVLLVCLVLKLTLPISIALVLLTFVACAMAAQSVGQTGIDPMEIFGLIVLLLIALFAQVDTVRLFFIAAIVAVACGLAGDVMNDFKAGALLNTSARAQWLGQAVGGIVGACVAVVVIQVLLSAYGPQAFGPEGQFIAAQASVVASMVSGISQLPAFIVGLVVGFALYLVGFPSMMLGLGIYLPFYMSLTAAIGALIQVGVQACARKGAKLRSDAEQTSRQQRFDENGLIIASGLLGGESIAGILLALSVAAHAFGG